MMELSICPFISTNQTKNKSMSNTVKSFFAGLGYIITGSLTLVSIPSLIIPLTVILGYITYKLYEYQNNLPEELPEGYYRDKDGIVKHVSDYDEESRARQELEDEKNKRLYDN